MTMSQHQSTSGTEGGHCPGACGTHYEMQGRAFGDCTGLTMVRLQEEPKAGTGTNLHDLGRNKREKTEE